MDIGLYANVPDPNLYKKYKYIFDQLGQDNPPSSAVIKKNLTQMDGPDINNQVSEIVKNYNQATLGDETTLTLTKKQKFAKDLLDTRSSFEKLNNPHINDQPANTNLDFLIKVLKPNFNTSLKNFNTMGVKPTDYDLYGKKSNDFTRVKLLTGYVKQILDAFNNNGYDTAVKLFNEILKKEGGNESDLIHISATTTPSTPPPEDTNALNQQIESLKQQLEQSKKEAADCKTARERLEAEKLQELKKLQQELDASRGLNANSAQLQAELERARQELKYETARANGLEDAQRKLEQERDALNKKLANQADLEATLAQLREQLSVLQNNQGQLTAEQLAELKRLQDQINQNKEDKTKLEAEINKRQAAIDQHATQLAALKTAHEEALRKAQEEADRAAAEAEKTLDQAKASLNVELEKLKAENAQLKLQIQLLEKDAKTQPGTEQLNERLIALQNKNMELAKTNAGLESEKNALTATNTNLQETIGTQDLRIAELDGKLTAATAQITELKARVAQLTDELAVAKVASGTEAENDKLIADLKQQLAAANLELNALNNTTIPGLQKQITELTFRNAQLQADLDNAKKTKPTPAVPAVDPNQITKLNEDLAAARKDVAEKQTEINDLNNKLADANNEVNNLKTNSHDLQPKLTAAEANLTAAESKLKDAESKLKDAESKLKDAESKLKDAESKLKDAEAKLTKEKGNLTASDQKVVKLNQQITDLQEALADCTKKPSTTTEIKSQSGTNLALNQGMVYIFQETRPLKGGDSATRRIKLQGENLFVEDENHVFQKFDQKFYKDMYVGGEDEDLDNPHQIDPKQIIEAVKNLIPKS